MSGCFEFCEFLPPAEISQELGHLQVVDKPTLDSSTSYHVFTPHTVLHTFMSGVLEEIFVFYKYPFSQTINMPPEKVDYQKVGEVIGDALENGLVHGGREKVVLGLFLGKKGACYGFQDFGDYFKRDEVKRAWENKDLGFVLKNCRIGDFHVGQAGSGFKIGVGEYIFPNSDRIFVDTNEGILYCVQMRESFIHDD